MNAENIKVVDYKERGKNKLPKSPFQTVAISLSGGGYRATSFHLGTLSYLSTIKWIDETLLNRARILSTVSAGSFVGIKYVSTLKNGGTIRDCYKSVYSLMSNCDLVTEALQFLSNDDNWNDGRQRSLINAFSEIYYQKFENQHFNLLWQETDIHLKEICFNATEFNFALPFCFYKTENKNDKHKNIGNRKIYIPLEVAKEIRLADIIAASSCFPFGFEPINFPDDFIHPESFKLLDKSLLPTFAFDGDRIEYPIELMDGSIYDNQGIDAVVASERRMKQYHPEQKHLYSDDLKTIDLYILSDVSSPTSEVHKNLKEHKLPYVSKWDFGNLQTFGICSGVIGILAIIMACYTYSKTMVILLTIFGTFGFLIAVVLLIFSRGITGLTKWFGVTNYELKRILHFDNLKFGTLYNLFMNRSKSGMKLVSEIFMKQMKWLSFERLYSDSTWKSRIVMNAARKLNSSEVLKRKNKHFYLNAELLNPSKELILVSEKANTKQTTLWFSDTELEGDKNMLNSLIACGQFTTCFNLLEYIEKIIKSEKYRNDYEEYSEETKQSIEKLYETLLIDWRKFNARPYWMVEQWNEYVRITNASKQ